MDTIPQTPVKAAPVHYPVCKSCRKPMRSRVSRGTFVKTFLFWLPLKRYKCGICENKRYVLSVGD